ncbi:MAG: hypothetical protein AAFY34_03880 [Pseudomonadota bacterium]
MSVNHAAEVRFRGGIDSALFLAIEVAKILPKGDGIDISKWFPFDGKMPTGLGTGRQDSVG